MHALHIYIFCGKKDTSFEITDIDLIPTRVETSIPMRTMSNISEYDFDSNDDVYRHMLSKKYPKKI